MDTAIVQGDSLRDIAGRFGTSKSALSRHRPHVGAAIVKAAERREEDLGDGLLREITDLQRRTLAILTVAEKDGDARSALVAIHQARENARGVDYTVSLKRDRTSVATVLRWGERRPRSARSALAVARRHLDAWLASEQPAAEALYRGAAERFLARASRTTSSSGCGRAGAVSSSRSARASRRPCDPR